MAGLLRLPPTRRKRISRFSCRYDERAGNTPHLVQSMPAKVEEGTAPCPLPTKWATQMSGPVEFTRTRAFNRRLACSCPSACLRRERRSHCRHPGPQSAPSADRMHRLDPPGPDLHPMFCGRAGPRYRLQYDARRKAVLHHWLSGPRYVRGPEISRNWRLFCPINELPRGSLSSG
jgi:hypothetical protein